MSTRYIIKTVDCIYLSDGDPIVHRPDDDRYILDSNGGAVGFDAKDGVLQDGRESQWDPGKRLMVRTIPAEDEAAILKLDAECAKANEKAEKLSSKLVSLLESAVKRGARVRVAKGGA